MFVYTDDRGLYSYERGEPFKAWTEETSVDIDHKISVPLDWIFKTESDKEYTDRFTVKKPK